MSAVSALVLSFAIWVISVLSISYTAKKQGIRLRELLNVRTLLVALFVAFSVVVISIAVYWSHGVK